ncbi:alpha/beta hydrolase [Alkalispirochaeta odontotermitis]|nr:alpha/beta hydrolase [Alkalispirochaeta odontotermitis]CAB1082532.1 Lysophospholipase (EC [Olavius algarvensis Delta 1 endosymbiont]
MKKFISRIAAFVAISAGIYCGIAAVLVFMEKPEAPASDPGGLAFDELSVDYANLPGLQYYTARDGTQLPYRHYPAQSDKMLVLLHGSGWHSRYFFSLAGFISSENLAQVYTPDLRGHGRLPIRRGDIDYIGQFEDDLAKFIAFIKQVSPKSKLILGGHSSGGGLAIRFAGSRYGQQVDAYLLLAPWLQYNAPTRRPVTGRWARPYTSRIIGLTMLNNLGIRYFNNLPVIEFNMPQTVRDGTETLVYTYRLNRSYAPRDYRKDLGAITTPLLVIAGTADEVFFADKFEPVISRYTDVQVKLLPGVNHLGVAVSPETLSTAQVWLKRLGQP